MNSHLCIHDSAFENRHTNYQIQIWIYALSDHCLTGMCCSSLAIDLKATSSVDFFSFFSHCHHTQFLYLINFVIFNLKIHILLLSRVQIAAATFHMRDASDGIIFGLMKSHRVHSNLISLF